MFDTLTAKEPAMNRLDAARGVRLGLRSPDAIRAGSAGEVTRAETVRPADLAPVAGGLCCEAIFGPRWAWRCACGGPARPAPAHGRQCCGACGATVARNPARGERVGHVELAVPCAHPWYARGAGGAPGDLATLLALPQRDLDRVLAHAAPMVVAVDEGARARALADLTAALGEARASGAGRGALAALAERQARLRELRPGGVLTEPDAAEPATWPDLVATGTGAPALRAVLAGLDLDALAAELAPTLTDAGADPPPRSVRRARLVADLRAGGQRPEWTVLTALPVPPPDLRPLVERPDGGLVGCDLTDLYLAVLRASDRYRRLAARTDSPLLLAVTGGVAGRDITAGLPRVEEVFEARRPAGAAPLAALAGTVTIARTAEGVRIRVTDEDDDAEQVAAVPRAARLLAPDGDRVAAGAPLADGTWDPAELLAAVGTERTARFLVDEVQAVYRAQGVAIHDTHVEVIVRQLLRGVGPGAPIPVGVQWPRREVAGLREEARRCPPRRTRPSSAGCARSSMRASPSTRWPPGG
jgi:hypothetical protein